MKISVITVCKNSEKTIQETILSVINQSYKALEYIIIDGKSEDNTLQIVDKYRRSISTIVSEKDDGIYYAMNKGIDRATGDYLFFLNADDKFLHNKVVEQAVKAFSPDRPDIIFGDIVYLNAGTGAIYHKRQNNINKVYVYKNMPCQPTVFYNKSVFEKCGKFRTDYKIVSDFAWMLNAILRQNVSLQYINVALNLFSSGGVSFGRYNSLHNDERARIYKEYFTQYELMMIPFVSRYLRSLTKIPIASSLLNLIIRFKLKNDYIDARK